MKKVAATISYWLLVISSLVFPTAVLAQGVSIPVQVGQPALGINPAAGVGTVLTNALTIVFVAAALAVLFFLIIGAFRWITSGGDKEAVATARKTIVNALVGLAILALSFLIVVVVGQILNIDILRIRVIPSLDACPGGKLNPNTNQCENILQAPTR